MKREIRCKSGAIPVAVNPPPLSLRIIRDDGAVNNLIIQPLFANCKREGDQGWGKPEDLPGHKQSFNAFGWKAGNVIAEEPLYFLLILLPEAVTQKLF